MIVLTRDLARRFRAVAKKCSLGRGPSPPVTLSVTGGELTLTATIGDVTLSLSVPHDGSADATSTLPMSVLASCEGANHSPVEVELTGAKTGRAKWVDRGVPRSIDFESGDPREAPPLPEVWADSCPKLLTALFECGKSAARNPARFAIDRVQVRGKAGQVIGTDGRVALVASGFAFPFTSELLLSAVPAFGHREFALQPEVRIASVEGHFALRAGPWTLWLRAEPGRFPDVNAITPRPIDPPTLTLDEAEALALIESLPRLPGVDAEGRPVTLELDRAASLLAAGGGESVELRLHRSATSGPPGRVVLDRMALARAIALGCRVVQFSGMQKPVICTRPGLIMLVMPLDATCAVSRTPAVQVVELPTKASVRPVNLRIKPVPTSVSIVVPTPPAHPETTKPVKPETNSHPPPQSDAHDPLAEAELLRAALADAAQRAAKLVALLRHQRRHSRAVESALAGLKSLALSPGGRT